MSPVVVLLVVVVVVAVAVVLGVVVPPHLPEERMETTDGRAIGRAWGDEAGRLFEVWHGGPHFSCGWDTGGL